MRLCGKICKAQDFFLVVNPFGKEIGLNLLHDGNQLYLIRFLSINKLVLQIINILDDLKSRAKCIKETAFFSSDDHKRLFSYVA